MTKPIKWLFVGAILSLVSASQVYAATINAASCSTANVQSAINSASNGDTVTIPNGNCTWSSGVTVNKRVTIRAQNQASVSQGRSTQSVILTNNSSTPLFDLISGNDYSVRVSGIRFNENGTTGPHIHTQGSGSKPPLVDDCYFEINSPTRSGSSTAVGAISWEAQGGVIWNSWLQGVFDVNSAAGESLVVKSPRAWATASTMGMADTGGVTNLYFEDSRAVNIDNLPDGDDNTRMVVRYSLIDGVFGSHHGFTSTYGARHSEWYNNTIRTSTNLRNLAGRYFWIRHGTILFTDNDISADNVQYGTPVTLAIGEIYDYGAYPVPHQPGWGHNGSTDVSDPIYIWGNRGTGASLYGWTDAYWQTTAALGRDVFVDSGAKPGWAPYTYPHPLRGTGSAQPPATPGTLTVQ